MADSPWRDRLRPASFRGAVFHVELGARGGGRRLAPHEYPKRDTPYVEDMGRKARAFPVTAYLIGPDYQGYREDLIDALEEEGPGLLIHPTFGEFSVQLLGFTCSERRERGGYCEFEMTFLESGEDAPFTIIDATQDLVRGGAAALESTLISAGTSALRSLIGL